MLNIALVRYGAIGHGVLQLLRGDATVTSIRRLPTSARWSREALRSISLIPTTWFQ